MNVDNNNKIISFQMGCITLEENTNYEDIRYTIDELNLKIEDNNLKYNYTGQSIHRLAYQYFTNNYDKNILSHCSPQLYDILVDKSSINSPFYEFYKKKVILLTM